MNIKLDKPFINNMVIFTPKTKEELQIALKEWCKNKEKAEKKYYHINTWDTSLITDMSELFMGKNNFNDDISNWNVSNVKTMNFMFGGAGSFNQLLNNWNVSNVKYMEGMFINTVSFNQDISNWNV